MRVGFLMFGSVKVGTDDPDEAIRICQRRYSERDLALEVHDLAYFPELKSPALRRKKKATWRDRLARAIRQSPGMSMKRLSLKAGMSESGVRDILNRGHTPT